jgi:hypothetical protein
MNAPWVSNDLHITIGVSPADNIDLQQEIKLIKAALLYADKVTIYSPAISTLQIAMQLGNLSDEEQLYFLEMVVPYLRTENNSSKTVDLLKKLRKPQYFRSREGRAFKKLLLDQFNVYWEEIKHVLEHMAENAGMSEIITAMNEGILEIHQFTTQTNNSHVLRFMADCVAMAAGSKLSRQELEAMNIRNKEMTKEFVDGVLDAVASGSTFPLFDFDTGNLVQLAQEMGHASLSNISQARTRHVALANDLFQRLPVFDKASTKDILSIRNELDKYLVRFRQTVINFASSVNSNPWDNDFEKEAELLFRKEISPSIMDLEDEIKSNNFLDKLARQIVDRPLLLTPGASLSVVLSQFPNLPKEIVGGLGLGAGAATLVYNTYKEWSDKRKAIERNGLFFYYQTGRKLEHLL